MCSCQNMYFQNVLVWPLLKKKIFPRYVIALKFDNPAVTPHSWLAKLAVETSQPYEYEDEKKTKIKPLSGPTYASLYISALYYTMSSLTTCGFGNIAPNTSAEKVFGCVTMLMGCKIFIY